MRNIAPDAAHRNKISDRAHPADRTRLLRRAREAPQFQQISTDVQFSEK
jgi:hypothetical protein